MLLSSGECATLGEASLLLRFLGNGHDVARYATYRENNLEVSMQDMRAKWSGFDDTYRKGVHNLMLDIYTNLSDGKPFFVDKTPRYTLIAEEIYKTFPNAKFIILWRHPLAVAASVSTTFYKGRWRFDDFIVDLTKGIDRLHAFHKKYEKNICSIRYEDLVSSPNDALKKIGDYLGLTGLSAVSDQVLPKDAGGNLGDPLGVEKYQKISTDSRDNWINSYSNWYRQNWAREYFKNPRSKWLEKLTYILPEPIKKKSMPYKLFHGINDLRYSMGRSHSHKKRVMKAFKKDHIYPYSLKSSSNLPTADFNCRYKLEN